MTERDANPAQPLAEPLTRREREILGLLVQGLSAPEIAAKLTLARSSVKWHVQQLYAKLGVNSKQRALLRAAELGLLGSDHPPVAAPAAPPHNLPLQVTTFFGREAEIDQLKQRLSKHRLVTLTGSGGVGKTRLSLATAEELLPDFKAGVWLVELAPLSDPALVPQQIAAALGIHDDPGQPILESLIYFLRERQFLLVLDNCEHLLAACSQLAAALLRACPKVRILASSREPLGIAGEAVFSVPSLSFPDPDHLPPLERMADYVSVKLFLDRARLVRPDYDVAAHNAAPIARICQRLDGIPLALEMAAARLNVLSAEQLADRLDDAFRVLTGGSRSALPRQQTLRATVDWSYRLLSEQERLLFQRLSVFAGGCTLEAAEAVCSGDGIDVSDVLDLLSSLFGRSLLLADRQPGAEPRYWLLEVTRQYAREKLQDSGESVTLHMRHRDYFLMFAESNAVKINTKDRLIWTRRFLTERENFRRSLDWAFSDLAHVDAGPRLVNALDEIQWSSRQELLDWNARGLAWCKNHPVVAPQVYVVLLFHWAGRLSQNDPPAAIKALREAVDISRVLGPDDREILMRSLFALASIQAQQLGDMTPALVPLAEGEAIFDELGPDRLTPRRYLSTKGAIASIKAFIHNNQGKYADAKNCALASIQLFEQSGDRWEGIPSGIALGRATYNLGEIEQARQAFRATLALVEESGNRETHYVLRWLGIVDLRQGQLARALEYCRASLREAQNEPDLNNVASGLGLGAGIAAKQSQPERAARLSGAAQALYVRQKRIPWENSSLDTLLPAWRDRLDAPALSAAFEAGLAMNAEQAVAYALSDDES